MNIYSLDFETANVNYSSICQIGITNIENNSITKTWNYLVNPEEYFDSFNISIHGITKKMVKNKPNFAHFYPELKRLFEDNIVIHHMPFDKIAFNKALEKYNLTPFKIYWLDSAKTARRVWEQFRLKGYGLKKIAKSFNIEFKHHDALEDATVAAKIILKALKESDHDINSLLKLSNKKRIRNKKDDLSKIDLNQDGILFGESLVFTGTLSISRKEAAKIAAQAGCKIQNGVNRETTLLVVGIQDIDKLKGYDKSSKHRKAEELIKKGQNISIISEDDFNSMI